MPNISPKENRRWKNCDRLGDWVTIGCEDAAICFDELEILRHAVPNGDQLVEWRHGDAGRRGRQ